MKKKGILTKLNDWLKNMKLRQRMILLYMIGCILPFALVLILMFRGSNEALILQQIENQEENLRVEQETLVENMNVALELSLRMNFNKVAKVAYLSTYGNTGNLIFDYRNLSDINEYFENYYQNISGVCFYIEKGQMRVDNRYFKLLTDSIKKKNWYQKTVEANGDPCWSYITNIQTRERSLRVTRAMYNSVGELTGIACVTLSSELTEKYIRGQNAKALLILNDEQIVNANFDITNDELPYVDYAVQNEDSEGVSIFEGERYIVSEVEITPRYSTDHFQVVLMAPVSMLTISSRRMAIQSLIPLLLGAAFITFAIFMLTNWFTKRIMALNKAMHIVTEHAGQEFGRGFSSDSEENREYSPEHSLPRAIEVASSGEIGAAKDEIWELYNDLNKMVYNMQKISDEAAEERIAKEQIYSRQRDVEFKMLATQINPHFLYNTLETVRMLAIINKQKEIEDISVKLTKLLRGSLEAGKELRPLSWEMDKVECYVRIQDYRFGDRIRTEIIYDKDISKDYMIIPFVIQPFVENAYVHAMEDMEEGGVILIQARISDTLEISIEDNGHGMSAERLEEVVKYLNDIENLDRTHIGICNVNQRIKLKFGEEYGVDFSSVEGKGTTVRLKMPLILARDYVPERRLT